MHVAGVHNQIVVLDSQHKPLIDFSGFWVYTFSTTVQRQPLCTRDGCNETQPFTWTPWAEWSQ